MRAPKRQAGRPTREPLRALAATATDCRIDWAQLVRRVNKAHASSRAATARRVQVRAAFVGSSE